MDTLKQGYLSRFEYDHCSFEVFSKFFRRDGLLAYFTTQVEKNTKEGSIDKIMGRRDRGAKRLDPGVVTLINSQVDVRKGEKVYFLL